MRRLIITSAVVGLLLVALGYTLGLLTPREPVRQTMVQTRLIVAVPCLEALDYADRLTQHLGAAIGQAARSDGNLDALIHDAEADLTSYQQTSGRCRSLADR